MIKTLDSQLMILQLSFSSRMISIEKKQTWKDSQEERRLNLESMIFRFHVKHPEGGAKRYMNDYSDYSIPKSPLTSFQVDRNCCFR